MFGPIQDIAAQSVLRQRGAENHVDQEAQLVEKITSFRYDPLGFALYAFPWGEAGSGLEGRVGPQLWQAEELMAVGEALRTGNRKTRRAVASGKGIGKSALVAILLLWALCTFPNTKIVLTAGTDTQLKTKTMPELAKWFSKLICKHWFVATATSIYVNDPDVENQKQWRMDSIPWNKNNPEAFQGLHNLERRLVVLFDEASQIEDVIWQATDGVMSDIDTEVAWLAYGNPTRGIGKFREAFNPGSRWKTRSIDSRSVDITDKQELAELIAENGGEDSDTVRWMVRGLFPRAASTQFISLDDVLQARRNPNISDLRDPLIMGVDVARFGDGKTVLAFRKGRDCRTHPWIVLERRDTQEIAARIAEMHEKYKCDAIFVDEGGVGGGVVDRLRALGVPHMGVQFGGKADRAQLSLNADRYANKRSEIWGYMKTMMPHLAIPEDDILQSELTAALYGYVRDNEIALVSKETMLKQFGVPSPDRADALALTFAYPVLPRDGADGGGVQNQFGKTGNQALTEYDHLAED